MSRELALTPSVLLRLADEAGYYPWPVYLRGEGRRNDRGRAIGRHEGDDHDLDV